MDKAQAYLQGAHSLGQEDWKADHFNMLWLSRQKGQFVQVEVLDREKSPWEIEGDWVVRVELGQVSGQTDEVGGAGGWAGLEKWAGPNGGQGAEPTYPRN